MVCGRGTTPPPPPCGYPLFPASFVEETILSLLDGLGTFIKNQSTIDIWVYFWTLSSVALIYMFVVMQIPLCFDYYKFEVSFKIWKLESLALFFSRLCQLFGALAIPHEF